VPDGVNYYNVDQDRIILVQLLFSTRVVASLD